MRPWDRYVGLTVTRTITLFSAKLRFINMVRSSLSLDGFRPEQRARLQSTKHLLHVKPPSDPCSSSSRARTTPQLSLSFEGRTGEPANPAYMYVNLLLIDLAYSR